MFWMFQVETPFGELLIWKNVEFGWNNVIGFQLDLTADTASRPMFRNLSEHSVVVCCCAYDWRCSLWLPLSQLVARLLTPGIVVKSNSEINYFEKTGLTTETSRFVLRVYGGLVNSLGLWGGFLEKACCMLEVNEQVDFDGGITWTTWQPKPFTSIISSWKSREMHRKISNDAARCYAWGGLQYVGRGIMLILLVILLSIAFWSLCCEVW